MENIGFKGLIVTLYQRLILSYKTTLLGILIAGLGIAADSLIASNNKILTAVGTVVGVVFALLKEKFPAPRPDTGASATPQAGFPPSGN
jgi:hypothetical protein